MSAEGLIGSSLGGYVVQAPLGSGGMASVYRGLDTQLQRPVAIKVLSPQAAAQPGFAERFRQEARLAASLRHPNIVQVYAFGEERGLTYMVQELLPGPTLEQRMGEAIQLHRRLSPEEIGRIVGQLAAALNAAHAAGIIHRDVKPANALWNASGALVLTDFGIAKATLDSTTQTQTGLVMGTPAYMAPEQGQGLPLSPASDVYSLGVVLYELLAGRVPFVAPTPLGVVIQQIKAAPPPLRELRPDLPPAVEAVVMRALAKDPQARFASAGALAAALGRAWAEPAAPPHQQPTRAWAPPALPRRAPAAPAAAPPGSGPAQPAPLRPPAPAWARQRPAPLLPALAALLLLVFCGGAFLALRGDPAAAPAPTREAANASPASEGAAPATAPAAPTSAPGAPADDPAGPAAQLRGLLEEGVAAGRAGPNGPALLAALDEAQRALRQGDSAAAAGRLAELQRALLAEARAGTLPPELLRQALSGIAALADQHTLTLPLSVSSD